MDWRQLERAVDKIERKAWGETVRLSFLKNGAADPARPQWTGRAILHTGGDDSVPVGERGLGGNFRVSLAAGEGELFLTRGEYDGPMPQTGDKVRALDRDDTPAWEVKMVSQRYSNLLVLSLTQA